MTRNSDHIKKPLQRSSLTTNLIVLHLTVFVWGFTAILGKLISIQAVNLVWYRVLIAFLSLLLYLKLSKSDFRIHRKAFFKLVFIGAIVALHWILFFQAIKSSTVSVTLVCLSSMTLFTAILEPLIKGHKILKLEIFTGLIIICGIYIIFKFESGYTFGIICGLLSALYASIFSIINSRQVKNHSAPIISFYELVGAWIWISVFLLLSGGFGEMELLNGSDFVYLLILGTICTSVAYVAGISVMKELSAFRVALVTNLEPIYGIILAFIVFGKSEQMTSEFYAGAFIVLATILLYPVMRNKIEKRALIKTIPPG